MLMEYPVSPLHDAAAKQFWLEGWVHGERLHGVRKEGCAGRFVIQVYNMIQQGISSGL